MSARVEQAGCEIETGKNLKGAIDSRPADRGDLCHDLFRSESPILLQGLFYDRPSGAGDLVSMAGQGVQDLLKGWNGAAFGQNRIGHTVEATTGRPWKWDWPLM